MDHGKHLYKEERNEVMKKFSYAVAYSDGTTRLVFGENWMGTYLPDEDSLMKYVSSLLKDSNVVGISVRKLSEDQKAKLVEIYDGKPFGKIENGNVSIDEKEFQRELHQSTFREMYLFDV